MTQTQTTPNAPINVTDEQIRDLRFEAGYHGDLPMVEICDIALGTKRGRNGRSRAWCRAECAAVIADAEAQEKMEKEEEMGRGKTHKVAYIKAYWDSQDRDNAGWYAAAYSADGVVVDDSMKVWWPVDMDVYGEDDDDAVRDALTEAYPGTEIRVL